MTETWVDPRTGQVVKCEVCNERDAIGVASIPGIPVSVAWCTICVRSGAIPYWAVVANTVICGGLDRMADWWQETVETTLTHLGKTREEFNRDVTADMEADRALEEELRAVTNEE